MARNKITRYHKHLLASLRDPQEAFEYLKAALEEDDMPEVFLLALRHVAEARGMSQVARQARLNRENLYRILSREGNPEFHSLAAILDSLGLKFSVAVKKAS